MSEKEIDSLSFEEALGELESIVRQLEGGNTKLEDAVATYERGVKLKNHCARKLKEVKEKVDKLVLDKNGTPVDTETFHDRAD